MIQCTKANSQAELEIDGSTTPSSSSVTSCVDSESRISNTTESSLLNSTQHSSPIICTIDNKHLPTIFKHKDNMKNSKKKKHLGPFWISLSGSILIIISFLSVIWTPYELLMTERLRMRPGLPPYDWWKNPPDEVLLKFYAFNITNIKEFTYGNDTTLKVQEIGPIIYREKLTHSNVRFNDNGTLTYTATRQAIYLPEMNTIDLNATIMIPNLAVLGIASYLAEMSFFLRLGFNVLLNRYSSEPFREISLYNFLWNMTDPILSSLETLVPFLVPTKQMGILATFYRDFVDDVTVRYGTEQGDENFFKMDTFRGSEYIFGSQHTCEDTIINSTEGVMYHQKISKSDQLKYWRKSVCRVMPLEYSNENIVKYGITGYKFTLLNSSLDRVSDRSDCYASSPELPDGLSDASKCYFDIPFASSFPHFLTRGENIKTPVEGLKPNNTLHSSYVLVEPNTGIPLEGRARLQSNLIVRKLSGYPSKIYRFSNTIIPMFWIEYHQVGIPWYLQALVYFTVNIVPIGQYFFSGLAALIGSLLLYYGIQMHQIDRKYKQFRKNAILHFEQENMLKQCT